MNNLRNTLATLLLLSCAALGQDIPAPAAGEPAASNAVPPVLLRDVRLQAIGEERDLEELPSGLIFLDASSGRVMVADEDDPHGRFVCVCRDIDWHSFTNDLRVNGHRILLNAAFSLQAEGGAVSLRHGTNSLLQILAADYGSLAPLSASLEDATHLLLTANAPADAVLQTTTNLLDPVGWQPAANAVVAEATDAATTWRITLLDGTVPEFYRVLATVTREAGIYAAAPIHAESGVTMGTNTWTEWPGTQAEVANAVAHVANTNNPHNVTLSQLWGGDASDFFASLGFSLALDDHVASIDGFGAELSFEEQTLTSESFCFNTTNRPTWKGDGLATTGEVAAVEGRVSALEMPDTCRLYWPTNHVLAYWDPDSATIPVPMDFPTRRLLLVVSDDDIASLSLTVPHGAAVTGGDRVVDVLFIRENVSPSSGFTDRYSGVKFGTQLAGYVQANNAYRLIHLEYDAALGSWNTEVRTLAFRPYFSGAARTTVPVGWPSTVAAWCTAHGVAPLGQAQALSMSPGLTPSLTPLSPAEGFDSEEETEEPVSE